MNKRFQSRCSVSSVMLFSETKQSDGSKAHKQNREIKSQQGQSTLSTYHPNLHDIYLHFKPPQRSSQIQPTFIAELATPVGFTETLPRFVASAMDTAWVWNAFVAVLALPSILTPSKKESLELYPRKEIKGPAAGKSKFCFPVFFFLTQHSFGDLFGGFL